MTFSAKSPDRANLEYYKEANSKTGFKKPGEKRVVFMGNSITEFWSTNHPEFFSENPYINRGINGQTTSMMLMRFNADVIQLKPDVVVIFGGTNDIAENSEQIQIIANINTMAQMAKKAGIKVVLCSVLPVYQYYWRPFIQPIEKIISLNNLIKTYTEENGMVYADYYSALVDVQKGLKDEYTWDGVHPNLSGYLVMEPIVKSAIQKALTDSFLTISTDFQNDVENFIKNLSEKDRQITVFTLTHNQNKKEVSRNILAKKPNYCHHIEDEITEASVREKVKILS